MPTEGRVLDAFTHRAYTTRRVPDSALAALCDGERAPRAGDLVLARVESLGHHTRLHLPNGRRQQLFVGDRIVVAYADRYAPSQFEALVPDDLGPCQLAAGGGVAARVVAQHARIRRGPTQLQPLGLVAAESGGPPINVADWSLPPVTAPRPKSQPVIAGLGSAMDSGKTTTLAYLAHGLRKSGLRVGYAKVTGTGAGVDPWLMVDAGADPVLDFTDVGHASTYRLSSERTEAVFLELLAQLQQSGVDVILVEVADGLLQPETQTLLASDAFRAHVDAALFACPDSLSAVAGASMLRELGVPLLALTGTLEAAPLLLREARRATGASFASRADLADAATAGKLVASSRNDA